MKPVIAVLLVATMAGCLARPAVAQDRGVGLGVILGEPTGLSGKLWLAPQHTAVDFALAWAFGSGGYVHAHATYLWHFPQAIRSSERFVPYAGVGARIGAKDHDFTLGVRGSAGIDWWMKGVPVDIFIELGPVLNLIPGTDFDMTGGLGARYFF